VRRLKSSKDIDDPLKILFLTDNFPPETNAPASRTYEHARSWVAAGHQVTVLGNVPNFPTGKVFPGYKNKLWQRETMDGIVVVRVWTYVTANEGFFRRSLDYFSFAVSGVLGGLFLPRPDVIVATSPQIFTALAGCILAWIKGRPFVFELRDLWPDSIVAVGAMRKGALLRMLTRLEYWLYRRAARIVSVTNAFKQILVSNGVPEEKIAVIRNAVDLKAFVPGPKPAELVRQLGLEGKFVAAYVGTIGMAHGLGVLLSAAEELRGRENLVFVLVGTGSEHAKLEEDAKRRDLHNVIFVGPVDKESVKLYWRLCDVALVLLRDVPVFHHVIPSKMFEAMGTGRPIILGVRGESQALLQEGGGGISIPPEDSGALAKAIMKMIDSPIERTEMGTAGRAFVERKFDRRKLALEMLKVLEEASGPDRPGLVKSP
jgi:putative colanic acid biosynthesis glycosyltransferase WcaI